MEPKQSHMGQQKQSHIERKRRSTGSGETEEELALKLLPGIISAEIFLYNFYVYLIPRLIF
jgi:hypothetical protein